MATGDFDSFYSSSPWGNISTNSKVYYEAMLQALYYQQHYIYGRFVDTQFNLGDVTSPTMQLNQLIEPHANFDAIGNTQLWMASSRLDSSSRQITFNRYAGKLALHEFNKLVTYWKGDNDAGLERIVQTALGGMQTKVLEKLARNAYLAHARKFIGDGSLSGFNQIDATKVMTTTTIEDVHQGMAERDVPYAIAPDGQTRSIFCVTTPGVIRGIKSGAGDGEWLDVMRYASPMAIVNNEQGSWKGVRFVQTNDACLYNVGAISAQTSAAAAITQGDGADDEDGAYLGVYSQGQSSNVTKYITVASASDFAVGDLVTIHTDRTSANGVTNGVDYTDGTAETRIIRKISGTHISFDRPIMEDFKTDLGSGVYAWMTKARHVHTATFMGGPGGVALGVGRAPRLHTPGSGDGQLPTVDDFAGMYRFSWDAYLAYQVYTPEVFEVWCGAGKNRIDFGATTI